MFFLIQIEVAIVPSAQYSTAVVEPYNAVFSTHESLMNSDCALFFDNASLYNMLSKKLEMYAPKYKDINRMVCQVSQLLLALSDIQSDNNSIFTLLCHHFTGFKAVVFIREKPP